VFQLNNLYFVFDGLRLLSVPLEVFVIGLKSSL